MELGRNRGQRDGGHEDVDAVDEKTHQENGGQAVSVCHLALSGGARLKSAGGHVDGAMLDSLFDWIEQ